MAARANDGAAISRSLGQGEPGDEEVLVLWGMRQVMQDCLYVDDVDFIIISYHVFLKLFYMNIYTYLF